MDWNSILALLVQGIGFVFMIYMGIILIKGMQKDGQMTADEASKVAIIAITIYMVVVDANRSGEAHVFDQSYFLMMLISLFALAKIDLSKFKNIGKNGKSDKGDDSKDGK